MFPLYKPNLHIRIRGLVSPEFPYKAECVKHWIGDPDIFFVHHEAIDCMSICLWDALAWEFKALCLLNSMRKTQVQEKKNVQEQTKMH